MATKDLNTRCPLPMPEYFTVPWARQWIAAAGGDPGLVRDTWCWADFGQHYPELIPVFVEYLKRATTGDPAWTAHWAREAGWMSTEDAVAVIKEARTGDLAWAAYWARREGWMTAEDAVAVEKEEERDDR